MQGMEDFSYGMEDNFPYLVKKRNFLFEKCVHKLIISCKQCLHSRVHVVQHAGTTPIPESCACGISYFVLICIYIFDYMFIYLFFFRFAYETNKYVEMLKIVKRWGGGFFWYGMEENFKYGIWKNRLPFQTMPRQSTKAL